MGIVAVPMSPFDPNWIFAALTVTLDVLLQRACKIGAVLPSCLGSIGANNREDVMNKKLMALSVASIILGLSSPAAAQETPRVYDLGPVVEVIQVKVEPGQLRAYMANLDGLWRRSMEDGKRRGEILDYGAYEVMDPRPGEGDLQLVVIYKNAAVLDLSLDEQDRRTAAMEGSVGAATQATVTRGKLRTIMGTQLLRELKFKSAQRR